jgi:hypothetical protein
VLVVSIFRSAQIQLLVEFLQWFFLSCCSRAQDSLSPILDSAQCRFLSDFWPKNVKARPNRLCFLRRFVTARLWAARIHGRDDSPKSSSRSAFPKNQPRSPLCPLSRLPTPSPATLDSSPICARSPVCRRRPKLQHSPPGSRLQSGGWSPSPATPVSIPCPLREQDIRSAPGPSRTRCSSTTHPTPPRCRPERRARASPHQNYAAAAELGLAIFSPRAARYGCLRFSSSAVLSCPQFRIAVAGSVARIRESVGEFVASNFD